MATGRSFAEFVKDECYNGLCQAAVDFVAHDWELLNVYTRNVHRIGSEELTAASIQRFMFRLFQG